MKECIQRNNPKQPALGCLIIPYMVFKDGYTIFTKLITSMCPLCLTDLETKGAETAKL